MLAWVDVRVALVMLLLLQVVPAACSEPGGAGYRGATERVLPANNCPAVPTLVSPTNVVVGENGGSWEFGPDQDAFITCQPGVTVKKTISLGGGRNVWVKGCEIVLEWTASGTNQRALEIKGAQKAYIEGVYADAADRCDSFTAYPLHTADAPPTTVKYTLINSWAGNNNYNTIGDCHGDCLQLQGNDKPETTGRFDVHIQNFTCMSKAQGFFLPDRSPASMPRQTGILKNVNARFGLDSVPRYDVYRGGLTLYYFMSPSYEADRQPWQVTLDNVYLQWNKSDRNVCPGPPCRDTLANFSDPKLISFATSTNIKGEIRKGLPPAGDFVPHDKTGKNYDRSYFCLN